MPTVTTRVAQTFKKPSIAESYGTFATLQAAMTYVENADIKCAGLTVGIDQPDGSVKEYWLQPVEGQLQFVEKGGTEVEANPEDSGEYPSVIELSSLKVGKQVYMVPSPQEPDAQLSSTSTNSVQNKVVKSALDAKANASDIPSVPTISTNIESDANSDTKTASPKAVKTFIEGKGYLTQHQDISGKVDKVANAQENNFASFNSNGGIKDSGFSDSSFIKGVKQNGTLITPVSGVVDVTVQDGEDGLSAFEIAQQQGFEGDVDDWLASLKANIGEFKFITPTDTTAEAALTAIGSTYASAIGSVSPSQSTLSIILLMNDSNNTKTMMIATQEVTPATTPASYEFVYAGDLQSAMPSNVLTKDDIIKAANTEDDLDITDEQGNIIVKFYNKHIETKNFNSALAPQEGDADRTLDYAVTDPNGKNIFGVQAGYPVTKHFDGATIKGMVLEHESEIGSLNTEVDALNDSIPIIDEIYGWESIDPNNPLKKIRFDAGLTPVIRHWGFIGDSLSSGCHGYDTGVGTGTGVDIYDYSWGKFICRLCGSEGYNFSYGGGTAKDWLTNSRGWPAAQITENHKQAYTIALGINDSTLMSSIYPDGLGDADTDLVVNPSNPYDYSNNNEDTYVGCYGGIIQRLRSVNPRCRIFVLTMLDKNFNHAGHLAMDSEIRKIASKFENVYVIDLALYAPQYYGSPLHDNLVYWSHLTSVGYVWLAYVINTYIDWIIRTNLYAFRDIAFIGTDKYMNQNL